METRYRWLACAVVCVWTCSLAGSSARGAPPQAAALIDHGEALGLPGLYPDTIVPAWLDLDQDGDDEAIWFAEGGVTALDHDLSVHTVSVPPALGESAGRPDPVGCVMDVDGDGKRELLVIGRELLVLEVSAPYTLTQVDVPNPALPPATALDIACGDLNGDGRPDAVLGLGIYSSERTENLGFPDFVLMNLGHGRFEIGRLEPGQLGFTQGIVLADLDGDRRPDVVESMDFSMISGASRVLYNRTPAGAQWPTFEEGTGVFDTGTCGMGAAVEDLNADGVMDIYNSSLGVDQLTYGSADGSFEDVTFELGFTHLWGLDGWRDQWSPTIADLNLDGRLDVLIRHGGVGGQLFPIEGPNIAKRVADLLYLQREDGTFERVETPFPDAALSHGRHAVLGDLDGDGRPDVGLGGRQGSATYWSNQTEVTGRALTLRLYPTVSGDPAVGTRATATCGGAPLARVWTSGGKMGGSAAAELYFAWADCAETVTLDVAWPAGGVTSVEVPPGQTRADAHEARWFELSPDDPNAIRLDPTLAAANSACLVDPQDGATCCDTQSAPCDLPLPLSSEAPWRVLLPGERPIAIDAGYERWSLVAEPRPLRAGQQANLHLRHVGDPKLLDIDEVFLLAFGDTVNLDLGRVEARVLSAEVTIPEDAEEVELKLWPDVFDEPWVLPTGGVFDSRWSSVDAYPYQVLGGVTEFWQWGVFVAGIRGMEYADAVSQLRVEALDGTPLESSIVVNPQTAGRAKVLVDWGLIGDQDTLRLVGGPSGSSFELPVFSGQTLESAVGAVDSVFGGLIMPRMIAHGDVSHVFFVLKDAAGSVLPPEEGVVSLEMELGEVLTQPTLIGNGYTYLAVVQSANEVGTGRVIARLSDGREMAAWSFENRPPNASGFSAERSEATLEVDAESGTITVNALLLNQFGEALGADANLTADLDGGSFSAPLKVTPEGVAYSAEVTADPYADELRVNLYVDGALFTTLIEPLEPTAFAPDTAEGVEDVAESPDVANGSAPSQPPAPRDSGGCAAGGADGSLLVWLLIAAGFFLGLRGGRRAASTVLLALVCAGAPQAKAVTFEDLSAALALDAPFDEHVVPLWMDVDQDGRPEPLWIAHVGWYGVDLDENGEAFYQAIETPSGYVQTEGRDIVTAVLDVDGDHTPELMVISDEVQLYRLTAPWTFERITKRPIALPPASVVDTAVGDLNGDGLPDVVAGMALYRGELFSRSGHEDVVLMNLGAGRFEVSKIQPALVGMTAGVALADMDGDGRLDFIESKDFTTMGEKSRILLNRTPPGAMVPTFVVDENTYDPGTYGMGSAIADINGDGRLDLYNSSLGRDLMVVRQPDGTWKDVTRELGLDHEWGAAGFRNQWSPMFLDLNADGLLDLLVRQGDMGSSGASMGVAMGPQLANDERDLLYIGQPDGRFERGLPPFHKPVAAQGRQIISGDLDDDGLADICHGGRQASAGLWRNVTELAESAQPLTLRFKSTISGWPPTGATVEGQCGEQTIHRGLTSGGAVGGTRATEIYLGWSGCDGARTVKVHWPSGVTTTDPVAPGARVFTAEEPRWWSLDPEKPQTVTLDPAVAGADQACLGSAQGSWVCCSAAEAPCDLVPPEAQGSGHQAKLDASAAVALPTGEPRWTLVTSPSPPRPGAPLDVSAQYMGDPRAFPGIVSGPSAPTLITGEGSIAWTHVDEDSWTLRTQIEVPADAKAVELTLFPFDLPNDPTLTLSVASAIDPRWSTQDYYPYRITGGISEYWHIPLYTTLLRGEPSGTLLSHLELTTLDGEPVPHTLLPEAMALSRGRFLVDPEVVVGVDHLVLRDTGGGFEETIEIFPSVTLEEALPKIDRVVGGLSNPRPYEDGDEGVFLFSVVDAQGRFLPPEPEILYAEADGAVVISQPENQMASYSMTGTLRSLPGTGPGEVRIYGVDGRLLGTLPFTRRARGDSGVDVESSTVEIIPLTGAQAPSKSGDPTHQVKVAARHPIGDVLGFKPEMELKLSGATLVAEETVDAMGSMYALVAVDDAAGELEVEVFLDGQAASPLTVPHEGHPFPSSAPTDVVEAAPDAGGGADAAAEVADAVEPGAPASPPARSEGCAASGSHTIPVWLWLAVSGLLWSGRRRGPALLLLALAVGAAPPTKAVTFEDLSGSTGIADATQKYVVPVWFDMDLDGRPEALWISYEGWFAVDLDAPDGPTLKTLQIPDGFDHETGPPIVTAALDAMGDPHPELLVIATEAALYRLVAPWTFEPVKRRPLALPPATHLDAAVGDLNADGRPDVIVAMSLLRAELFPRSGSPDVVLMNLGHGRFEPMILEPSLSGLTNGLTLADLNGDGRLDVIESQDLTSLTAKSRILYNHTPPGAMAPTFVVGDHIYDTGTYGMGAAVEDIDGDGALDIYNSSLGRDLVVLAQPDGSWKDVTVELGFRHEWGTQGMRNQWSPTLLDLNGNGRLDLFVRQGGNGRGGGILGSAAPNVGYEIADLLYIRAADGTYHRAPVPFHIKVATRGRHGAIGDGDDDGLPDILHGGETGSAGLWRNDTDVATDARPLTVRFSPTVSGWPPTGARVTATCDDATLTRTLTSGGHHGSTMATELYIGSTGCQSPTQLEVRWPSGVTTQEEVSAGESVTVVSEPAWWSLDPDAPGTVTLDPGVAGAEQACVGSPDGQWVCCHQADGPCSITPPEAQGGQLLVKLHEERTMALPMGEPRWTVSVAPSPPRPGVENEVFIRYEGDPREFEALVSGPGAPTLMHGLSVREWKSIDTEALTLSTFIEVTEDHTSVELTLFPYDLPTSPTWVLQTATAIHPEWAVQHMMPYRVVGGATEFWHIPLYTTLIEGETASSVSGSLGLFTAGGDVVDATFSSDPMVLTRARFTIDPEVVVGEPSLTLRDLKGSFERTFEIFPHVTLEDAMERVGSVAGGVINMRLLDDGDVSTFMFSARDAQGHYMPPEPELFYVEIEGGELYEEVMFQGATYTMAGTLRTTPGLTTGHVRVFTLDGRLQGELPFQRRTHGNSGVSIPDSSLAVLELEDGDSPEVPHEATHRVSVVARDALGDCLGVNPTIEMEVEGGAITGGPTLHSDGGFWFEVAAPDEPGTMEVQVYLDGQAMETVSVPHEGHPFPEQVQGGEPDEVEVGEPDGATVDDALEGPAPASTPRSSSSGCGAAGGDGALGLWILAILLVGRGRRRVARLASLLSAAIVLAGAAPPPANFVSYGESLELIESSAEYLVPFWIDIDQDGLTEAVFLDVKGARAVDLDPSGELAIHDVQISSKILKNADRPELVVGVLDIDRDGAEEVVIVSNVVHILEVSAPNVLSSTAMISPSLPGASALELAVGDLNADGWPDMIVGFGVYTSDRMELRGTADVILMNLGEGRLETHLLEPQRDGFTNGITLADLNGDGLPDVIESIDASPLVGPSRILMNTTAPGARQPTFAVHPYTYDTGTYGMGAAVDDVDQDGTIDIYNTSVGRDLLSLGRADGSYEQAADALGIVHEWGIDRGQRMQWSPTFSDMNADGRLDILVRQGSTGTETGLANGPWVARTAPDLLYLQDETGAFQRAPVPYDPRVSSRGRQAVMGDLDRDGLRDVALGGQGGQADFWMNETEVPDSTRLLVVEFAPTVSANPPVGAALQATCGGVTRTRIMTSGGKMGGSARSERAFAWPECDQEPEVSIHWPSGATTTHTAAAGEVFILASEPEWVAEGALGDTWVRLDPTGTGAAQACLQQLNGSVACCALEDAPCELELVLGDGGSPLVTLGGGRDMALAAEEDRWSLTTDPPLPEPGGTVTLQVAHRGRASRFDPGAMTLIIDAGPEVWETVDEERRTLELTTTLPEGLGEVPLKLFPKDLLEPTWVLPTGTALDARWQLVDPYPYRVEGGITELWHWSLYLDGVRHKPGNSLTKALSCETPEGEEIPSVWSHLTMGRSRLRAVVDWENLVGVETLVVRDGDGAVSMELPAPPSLTLEEAALTAADTHGGLMKNNLVEGGDLTSMLITLTDANGVSLPPEPETVLLELDGAELVDPLDIAAGSYDLFATIRTLPGLEPGEVRLRTTDGRVIGSWSFERRPLAPCGVDVERSWIELVERSPLDPPEVTHRVEFYALNSFDELMGANVDVQMEVEGVEVIQPPRLIGTGIHRALIAPSPGASLMAVTPVLDGESGTRVEIVAPPTDPPVVEEVDAGVEPDGGAQDATSGQDAVEEEPPPAPPSSKGGCDASGSAPTPLAWWVLLGLLWTRRARSRALVCGLTLSLLSLSLTAAAAPSPAVLEDLGGPLGLAKTSQEPRLAAWLDVDLDGAADPLWITYQSVHTLSASALGEPSLQEVSAPDLLDPKGGPRMSIAVLDVEGDGQDELLIVGRTAEIFGVSAPFTLERKPYDLPVLPAVQVIDIAVGDFNADGRVDVLLGLGIFSGERVERRGYPDMLLMNVGLGRFELVTVEPSRECYQHGVTAVDMNGDGRLDIVESCDASYFVGPSRVLLNQTAAGATEPVFEPMEHVYDTGTFGMGASVADIDGDGLLDIYNTNIGNDLVSRSTSTGAFEDITFDLGFEHEFGFETGGRTQWSPTWADLNLDGRYDVVVRQGNFGTSTPLPGSPGLAEKGSDLLYLGDADGRFVRVPVPFNTEGPHQGRQAVLGDADRDGRLDVALGGLEGSAGYWRNATPVPDQGRALTVELRGTVSGSPPIGAVVTGACADQSLTRRLTSGGHFGGMAANQLGFAWATCASEVLLEVAWPSGATTQHKAAPGAPFTQLEEPAWVTPDTEEEGALVVLPELLAEAPCFGTLSTPWTCCELEEEACGVAAYEEGDEDLFVQVGQGPVRLLRAGDSRWVLQTAPSPPIPGEPATLRLYHVGPQEVFDPTALSVFVDGALAAPTLVDEARQVMELEVDVPMTVGLEVALFPPDLPTSPTWIVPTGRSIDPLLTRIDTYPYRILGGVTEFWEWAAFVVIPRDRPTAVASELRVETPQGALLESTLSVTSSSLGRARLLVPWESLEGLDTVVLRDGEGGAAWELPLPGTRTLEEATAELTEIVGGIAKNRLLEAGDIIPVFMMFLDSDGQILSPEADMVYVEADGAVLTQPPAMIPGTYNVYAFLETEPGVGPGEVRVYAADDRLLGAFPFQRRARGQVTVSAEHSHVSLTPLDDPERPDTLYHLRVAAMNPFGEPLGVACVTSLEIDGGAEESPLRLETSGHQIASLRSDGTSPEMVVRVVVEGVDLGELSVSVPFEPPQVEEELETDVNEAETSPVDLAEPSPPVAARSSGCASGSSAPPSLWAWLLSALVLVALRSRRARLLALALALLAGCGEPTAPTPGGDADDVVLVEDADSSEVEAADGVPETSPEVVEIEQEVWTEDPCADGGCPPDCGPHETLDPETGACVCSEDACADPWSGSCIAQYRLDDFASVSSEKDVLAEIRVDLLERYVDLEVMREHVYERLTYTESTAGSFLWQKFGYLLISDHMCSLYQLGVTEQDPFYSQAILDAVEPDDTKMYMPLVLSSIVTGRVDQCVLHGLIDTLAGDLEALLQEELTEEIRLALKGALTRYLVTIDFYGIEFDGDLVGTVSELIYPTWTVESFGVWDSALVYDLVNAYYLALNINEVEILTSLDTWWLEFGGVELADCAGEICPIKGVHQVVFIDAMLGFIPEDKLVQIASLLLSNIGEDGSYGFPALLGLEPSVLWEPSYCDIFCSSKHWHISFALNHLVTRLEHREDDIKAGAALLEL